MNKQGLVEAILKNKDANIDTKAQAERAINAVLAGIAAGLKKDANVQLIGFGTFKVNHRAARTGRNPKTGDEIQIAAANVPAFVAGKALKESVN